ncbi:flagellar hook protein FlgE [Motiliproteus sp. MSK22-1]|uniref:flagellar hook protein FlgE n=1 Tax=Motiliproteus sp. MSK22-1 TaxID=1897630 RepID=UPI0009783A78|nr:flagellar hook-basal body complex protein [Motiliproteus sp. MSK22-1]OMH30004.1 flagellar biosynthesis protein FlgE [Motiliproteus sp. MSK22-1]
MAFNTAITGLKASTIELDVTGNNIANASTVGFKSGRTEFADIFTTVVVGAGSSNNPGAGVIVSDIAQDFTAGTIEFTNNNLDLAIDGSGFFQLDDGQGGTTYTRAGGFELDKDGKVVSKNGKFLQGFGLDAAGNMQPLGDLVVSEKENDPKATENISLSVNIDSRSDATALLRPYDTDDSGTFTFSTTTRSFDSLGNENTIKFDFIEQPPFRERQTLSLSTTTAAGNIEVGGVVVALANGDTPAVIAGKVIAEAANIMQRDPRIASITADPTNADNILITYKASAADVEEIVVSDVGSTGTVATNFSNPDLIANEVQAVEVATPTGAAQIFFGGVAIDVSNATVPPDTSTDVVTRIVANQTAIIEANPTIDSLTADLLSTPPRVLITYKPEEGNVAELVIDENGTGAFAAATTATIVENGDDTYQGVYQVYGYLNGTELLDIGKQVPAGATGSTTTPIATEPGPILLRFSTVDGTLTSVNNTVVSGAGTAPKIILTGADPADPSNLVEMDITGTTQFASESIVKQSTQDGFAKGDLIGVTFAANGTMVASFSNGQNSSLGIVALATFENMSGLQSVGDTEWAATLDSGQAILNPPGTGLNGALRSSALEQSNVDLSEELVALIEAQRNFQANSKTLQTENAVTQTILQIS